MATDKPTGNEGSEGAAAGSGQRLGGARADFVASLGRKIADLRAVVASVEAKPDSALARDDLRRKLHALGSGAKLLHFEGMARCILDTEAVLDRAAEDGVVRPADLERVARALDELPTLAWGEERPKDLAPSVPPEPPSAKTLTPDAVSVLVVGPEDLADSLVEDDSDEDARFDCERTDDLTKARSVTLALAPDVVILDGDLPGATDLAALLLDDPLTETVPVIVVLTSGTGDGAERLMALGVAKILPRPLRAGALQAACQEAIDQRDGKTVEMTLGEPTVRQLGERLALEVRRALVDAVDPHGRSMKVKLGDGAEVWGALWGAIARVREVVTTQTGGMVQFSGQGPEGAVPVAPVLMRDGAVAASDRAASSGRNRDEAMNVDLAGRRVIVADDDPGVTWFIADLLRTAGCEVHEALDGRTALRMAYELSPELVVSDILMPGLDGFALCRALRRDVALRDTPVILLSWKEDLLQRVRELGASAAAYLRKESDARAILARVREVMRPRARIAARLQGQGEVRGRLDGLTVRTLFELVLAARPAARVSVRDASFLYEVELRGGGIHRASRTSGDGSFLRGDRVIPAMLGVGAGRFVVSSTKTAVAGEATVSLAEQFAKPIALARAALHATTGARMMTVAKLTLDEDDVSGYLLATPEPARELVRRLARGTSPREILLHGDVSPALVEDVLADLATRGAIVAVYRADGSDAMRGEAFDAKAVLPDDDGGRSSLTLMPPGPNLADVPPTIVASFPAPAVPAASPDRGADESALGASLEAAVLFAVKGEEASESAPRVVESSETPAEAALKDLSIPVVVEPTADLRVPAGTIDSGPLTMSARLSRPIIVPEPNSGFPRPLGFGIAVLGLALAGLGVRYYLNEQAAPPPRIASQPAVAEAPGVTYGPLPAGESVPPGQGLLTVLLADGLPVRIDGAENPKPRKNHALKLTLPPGVHLVSVGVGDRARSRILEVRAGSATNVNLDEP